jgi:hypothetical protein
MIQINVLPPANPMVTTMMRFPEIAQGTYDWVNQQRQAGMQMLTSAGQQFLSAAADSYKHLADGSLTLASRRMARFAAGVMHPNAIIPLETVEEIRAAKLLMQRYIMACPSIREIYHRQLCDGYSDTYVDQYPNQIGEDHYDFRRVMNGVLQVDPEDADRYVMTEYLEELIEGDRELDMDEQFTIIDIWDKVQDAITRKLDPTDIFGGELGI